MPVKCQGCKYYDSYFGCVCNEYIFPCEVEEVEGILQENFPELYIQDLEIKEKL